MKRIISFLVSAAVLFSCAVVARAQTEDKIPFDVNAKSAVLIDTATGTVLYSKNADAALPPASVTKIMTLLLFMEEVDC